MITLTIAISLLFSGITEFVPLFNGENLDGWTIVNGDKSTWVVKDNMIVTSGKPTGVIRTNKMYENFVLELDWRHMEENGNAGLFVWSDPIPSVGVPFTRSIEVQIMDGKELDWYTTHGDIFSIWGSKMVPDRPHPDGYERCLPIERRSNPSPQWNHYTITCVNGKIDLSVNGAFISGATNVSPCRGYICLEAEGTEAHFKNIQVMELPPSSNKITKEANSDIGFITIFNGLNLDGWQSENMDEWYASNNVIHCKQGDKTLQTKKTFEDATFMFDYKCNEVTSSVFVVVDGKKTELPRKDDGGWTRFSMNVDSGTISIGGNNVIFTNLFTKPDQCKIPPNGTLPLSK